MQNHRVRVHRSDEGLPRERQLAWAISQVAVDPVEVTDEVADMIVNRFIDNAGVAAASVGRSAPSAAREQALAHPPSSGGVGAAVFAFVDRRRAGLSPHRPVDRLHSDLARECGCIRLPRRDLAFA